MQVVDRNAPNVAKPHNGGRNGGGGKARDIGQPIPPSGMAWKKLFPYLASDVGIDAEKIESILNEDDKDKNIAIALLEEQYDWEFDRKSVDKSAREMHAGHFGYSYDDAGNLVVFDVSTPADDTPQTDDK